VVATTTIVGDVVEEVGGEAIALTVLLPRGADPHSFDPTPRDVARLVEADIIFINGIGLEETFQPILESAGAGSKVLAVSEGVPLRVLSSPPGSADGTDQPEVGAESDPHVWTDPSNVKIWVDNIAGALSELDPQNKASFAANAQSYREELDTLDDWISEQVGMIPKEDRKMVTDHAIFGYFADRYGLTQVGAVVPGYSTLAEPSAQDLARLEDAIRSLGVKAVFIGNTINPDLSRRLAEDTGVALVFLYTGSLSDPDGPAGSYIDYMRFNVREMVAALR
jgi:ABC-type Zn uptake system ZnuABC Zn-binding protein ZnuA